MWSKSPIYPKRSPDTCISSVEQFGGGRNWWFEIFFDFDHLKVPAPQKWKLLVKRVEFFNHLKVPHPLRIETSHGEL